ALILGIGRFRVLPAIWTHLIECLAGIDQFIPLPRACLASIFGIEDLANGMGMTDERHSARVAQGILRIYSGVPRHRLDLLLYLPAGRLSFRPFCTVTEFAHAEDDVADPVNGMARHTYLFNSGITGIGGNAAPFCVALRRFVIGRHVLGPVARQSVDEFVLTGEVVAAIVQVH